MNNRRQLLVALGAGALAAPLASFAQPRAATIPHVGYLVVNDNDTFNSAFRQGLRELGYIEGRNIIVDYRSAKSIEQKLPELAAELVRLKSDVLVAPDPPSYRAVVKTTKTIPVVMRASSDPVAEGVVGSLAHPGGNVTGVFSLYSELNAKRLELLKEAVPAVSRVMVLFDPNYAAELKRLDHAASAARMLGLHLIPVKAGNAGEFKNAFRSAARARANGLLVLRAPLMVFNSELIARLAAKSRLPAVFDEATYANAGGFMSYGASLPELYRHLATYVDKILKGAKPGDLPVEQPTKFEMVVNMKTAKALGVKIPNSILVRADRVIE